MKKVHTKETAEAILRELPSVLGAFVREDVNGHPRDVHVLITPGPEPRHLARDIRDLLEERLGVPVDQRVISVAQLSDRVNELPLEDMAPAAAGPGPTSPAADRVGDASAAASVRLTARPAAHAAHDPDPVASAPRLVFDGIESATRDGRIEVRVRLNGRGETFEAGCSEIEGGHGRVRAAAAATLRAASDACGGKLRLELETACTVAALGREYVLVTALAVSPLVGRRPLALAGAHPIEAGAETAAALAALQASNRVLGLALRG